jgi:DUF4097 and DUF4098 domain-containing protein YvlB
MKADVEAGTVTGRVRVSTRGIGRNDWDELSFSTVSGDIVLELPENLNANVRFNTLSGDIDSDWPIANTTTRRNRYGPRGGMRGTIGNGGGALSVSTVSGNLERESEIAYPVQPCAPPA